MKVANQTVTKHFSWVPVAFLTFAYNRDLLNSVKNNAVTETGLLGIMRAFYSSNWQTIKKFRETAHPIPPAELMVKHVLNLVNEKQDGLFYSEIYWTLKEYNRPEEDRDERRVLITDQLIKDNTDTCPLAALRDHNVIRAAVDVIDEMFYRDGTYPRAEKKKFKPTRRNSA
jgi:hypothetical protein